MAFLIVFGAGVLILGLVYVILGIQRRRRARGLRRDWRPVPATVIAARVSSREYADTVQRARFIQFYGTVWYIQFYAYDGIGGIGGIGGDLSVLRFGSIRGLPPNRIKWPVLRFMVWCGMIIWFVP